MTYLIRQTWKTGKIRIFLSGRLVPLADYVCRLPAGLTDVHNCLSGGFEFVVSDSDAPMS